MKLIIDIDDKTYKMIKDATYFNSGGRGSARVMEYNALKAIYDGKPLPKGYGRLIDADKLYHCECKGNFSECDTCLDDALCNLVNNAPTIIEADKESV